MDGTTQTTQALHGTLQVRPAESAPRDTPGRPAAKPQGKNTGGLCGPRFWGWLSRIR